MEVAMPDEWQAYPRADGRKGIRNVVAVAYYKSFEPTGPACHPSPLVMVG
jgi:hypothetical protein